MQYVQSHKSSELALFVYQDHVTEQRRFLATTYKEFWSRLVNFWQIFYNIQKILDFWSIIFFQFMFVIVIFLVVLCIVNSHQALNNQIFCRYETMPRDHRHHYEIITEVGYLLEH